MSSEAELKGLLAVAEHQLKCAEIRASHAERNWSEVVEAFHRLEADRKRIWDELVPAETKALIEKKQQMEKELRKAETDRVMDQLMKRRPEENA